MTAFNKEWFEKRQKLLLWLLNAPLIKRWFRWILRIHNDCSLDEKIIKILPNTYWIDLGAKRKKSIDHPRKGLVLFNKELKWHRKWLKKYGYKMPRLYFIKSDFRTHDKFSKRIYYAFYPVWWLAHQWDMSTRFAPQLNLGFDTFFPDANPETTSVDGPVGRQVVDQTFADIIAGAGAFSSPDADAINAGYLKATTTTDQYSSNIRSIYLFDTASLSDTNAINSATLSLWGRQKGNGLGEPDLHIVASTPASNTALVDADYAQLGSTDFGSVTYANFITGQYVPIPLNASGIADISKTSISKFGAVHEWDIDSSFGGTWSSNAETNIDTYAADQAGTVNDPRLITISTTYKIIIQ